MIDRRIEQFRSGKYDLTGQWDGPIRKDQASNAPGVIFCHGFTGNRMENRRMFSLLSRQLAQKGCFTFRFDHRGCGDSEGDFADFTKEGLLEDLDAALKVFLRNPQVDPARTAVVGYSLGGLSANYLLSQRPEFLTAVLWAAVAQPDIIRDRLATYPDFPNYTARGHFDYGGVRVSGGYIDKIGVLNPLKWAKAFPGPILFINGEVDPIVKPEQADLYLKQRNHSGDRQILIRNGDHGFGTADNIDLVIDASEQWMLEKLAL